MLVGKLATQIRYATALGRIEIKFEPLVAEAVVVDLETPLRLALFVAELAGISVSPRLFSVDDEKEHQNEMRLTLAPYRCLLLQGHQSSSRATG